MTQKERLIKLLCEVKCEGSDRQEGGCGFRQDGKCNRIDKLDMCMIACIAEHLLENGVIVPELKTHDRVYAKRGDVLREYRVDYTIYDGRSITYKSYVQCDCDEYGNTNLPVEYRWLVFTNADIGITTFLTREEAEKALAERMGK